MTNQFNCPVCGKPNEEDAVTCQHCGADLIASQLNDSNQSTPAEENWLDNLRDQSDLIDSDDEPINSDFSADQENEEISDWLDRINNQTNQDVKENDSIQDKEEKTESQNPDWLKELQAEVTSLNEADDNLEDIESGEDWISDLRNADASSFRLEETLQIDGEKNEESNPDWLKQLSTWNRPDEEPESTDDSSKTQSDELPDWLANSNTTNDKLPDTSAQNQGDFSLENAPNENSDIEKSDAEDQILNPELEKEYPHWLNEDTSAVEQSNNEPPNSSLDLPDWLQDYSTGPLNENDQKNEDNGHLPEQPFLEGEALNPDQEDFNLEEILSEQSTLPEWLSDYSDEDQEPVQAFFEDDEIIEPEAPEKTLSPFESENIPEWLSEVDQEETNDIVESETEKESTQPDADEISPAQLPSWLQAMRPVESVIPQNLQPTQSVTERTGILAGLPGILPAENSAEKFIPPPVYSTKLEVNDNQRLYVSMLETILAEEIEPNPRVIRRTSIRKPVTRMVISFLLLLVLSVVLIFNSGARFLPSVFSPETVNFYTILDNMGNHSDSTPAVLVALDYEPALAGEMQTISQPVIEKLMQQNANISILSTNPTGPVLTENLVANANRTVVNYDRNLNFNNLGYLAGGASGLLTLSQDLTYALPTTFDGRLTGDIPALQDLNDISKFDSVIVLTENSDTARYWLEQVSPTLGDTPFLMVVSSQAGPAIQPYVNSGQIDGLITGLAGSAAFNQLNQSDATGIRLYWTAYQIGMIFFILIILIGGLIQLVRLSTHSKPSSSKV